jgi:hypothetical protein
LRKQGKVEEAYEAIRPMYRVHKGYYTSLCMYLCASDVFRLRMAAGRIEEATKIYLALKKLLASLRWQASQGRAVPFISDKDGSVTKFMAEAAARLDHPFNPSHPCSNNKIQRLLAILQGEMSVREMMAALGFGSRDKFLKNYLSPALKSGLIEMTDPNSPKSPKQRYRRTNRSSEN